MASKEAKCSKCSQSSYKDGFCIDCFRKFSQSSGRRNNKPRKKAGQETATEAAVNNLLSSVKTNKKFGKMVRYSLACITKLAVDENAIDDIIATGALTTCGELLGENKADEDVVVMVNETIAATCINEATTAAVVLSMRGKMDGLVYSLSNHLMDDSVVSTAKSFAILSKHPDGRKELAEGGGIAALGKCIKERPYNLELLRSSATALSEFAKDPRYAAEIMKSGIMADMLEAMKRFPDDLVLAEATAALIANMAKSSPELAKQLKAMGAIDLLVEMLERHPHSGALTLASSDALRYLAGEEDIASALSSISVGLASGRPDKKTAKSVSKVAALCLSPSNVDYMHANGGVDAVVAVVKGSLESKEGAAVIINSSRALQRLATDPKKSYAVMQSGGVRALVSSLEKYSKDPVLAEASIGALAAVLDRKEHAQYVGKVGGIAAALSAIKAHLVDPNVAKTGIKFISGVASYPESIGTLIEKGGVDILASLIATHMANPEITRAALQAFGKICANEAGRHAVIMSGSIPLLVKAIKSHPDDPDVIKASLQAMLNLLADPRSAAILKAAGAIEAITAAMDRFPGDEELVSLASKVLKLLAEQREIQVAQATAQAKREVEEKKQQVQIQIEIKQVEDDIEKNKRLWDLELENRKMQEADRLRAYEEMKLREADNLRIQAERTALELQTRAHLEARAKAIRENQTIIDRIKQEKELKEKRKAEAKQEAYTREVWRKYDDHLETVPDFDGIERRARLRDQTDGVAKPEEDDEDDELV